MQVIPLVLSDAPAFMTTTHTGFPKDIINNDIDGEKSGAAILNNTTLGIYRTQAMQTKSTGENCDSSNTTWHAESKMCVLG